jgi:hypothetical protein
LKSLLRPRPFDYYLLWLVALVSLGINLYLAYHLQNARRQVGLAAGTAALAVGQLRTSAFEYPVVIHEQLPISLTVDFEENVAVPISYTLPISTEVRVPLQTPLGTFPINVPVVTTIPIDLEPTVPLSLSVPISLSVPVDLEFPIRLELEDSPVGPPLAAAENYLRDLAVQFGNEELAPLEPTRAAPR